MKLIDAHRTGRARVSHKAATGCKAADNDLDIFDLRDRCTARWDYASPAVLMEIEEYVEALLGARK